MNGLLFFPESSLKGTLLFKKNQNIGKVNFGQYGTFNMGPGGDVLLVEVDNAKI